MGRGGGRRSDLKGKENSARSPDAKGRAGLSGYLFVGDKITRFVDVAGNVQLWGYVH